MPTSPAGSDEAARIRDDEGRQGRLLVGLEHDAVAGRQSGRDLAGREGGGIVPGDDRADHALRAALHDDPLAARAGVADLVGQRLGEARGVPEVPRRPLRLVLGFPDGLADLRDEGRGELVRDGVDGVGQLAQRVGTLGVGAPRPVRARPPRALDGGVDVLAGRVGHGGQRLTGRGFSISREGPRPSRSSPAMSASGVWSDMTVPFDGRGPGITTVGRRARR